MICSGMLSLLLGVGEGGGKEIGCQSDCQASGIPLVVEMLRGGEGGGSHIGRLPGQRLEFPPAESTHHLLQCVFGANLCLPFYLPGRMEFFVCLVFVYFLKVFNYGNHITFTSCKY